MAKPATKKAPAKVAPKVKVQAAKKSTAKFVSLTVRAVIPTQAYGNIQPEIAVTAATYEEAKAFVMPLIEGLFGQYSESKPTFLGKIAVEEKVVSGAPTPAAQPRPMGQVAQAQGNPMPAAQDNPAPVAMASAAPLGPKPDPVLKAEKAIGLAATNDAAVLIQDQIEKSVKIPAEYKPGLIDLVLAPPWQRTQINLCTLYAVGRRIRSRSGL